MTDGAPWITPDENIRDTLLTSWNEAISNNSPTTIDINGMSVVIQPTIEEYTFPGFRMSFYVGDRLCTVEIGYDYYNYIYKTISTQTYKEGTNNHYNLISFDRTDYIDVLGGYDTYGMLITTGFEALAYNTNTGMKHVVNIKYEDVRILQMYEGLGYTPSHNASSGFLSMEKIYFKDN